MWCGSVHLVSCHKGLRPGLRSNPSHHIPWGHSSCLHRGQASTCSAEAWHVYCSAVSLQPPQRHIDTTHAVLHHYLKNYQHFPDASLLACLQLEDAQQKVAAAAAVSEAQRRHSCASIAEEDSEEHPGLSLEGAATPSRQTQSPQPAMLQQQESPQQQQPEQHSKGLAGSFTAALSNAASGFSFSAGQRDDDHEQPPRQQTPPPLSPFALARKFVADREADAMARLKVGAVQWQSLPAHVPYHTEYKMRPPVEVLQQVPNLASCHSFLEILSSAKKRAGAVRRL